MKKLSYLGSVKDGKVNLPFDRLREEAVRFFDGKDIRVSVSPDVDPKTYPQLKAFHGPICQQVQAYELETNGVFKSLDRIKDELKNEFLIPEPIYYSDGSPVMERVPHPEKKGVFFEYHVHKVPSLASLSVHQMIDFITAIQESFLHERNWPIVIEEKETA